MRNKGFAALIALTGILISSLFGIIMLRRAISDNAITHDFYKKAQANQNAETGVNLTLLRLTEQLQVLLIPTVLAYHSSTFDSTITIGANDIYRIDAIGYSTQARTLVRAYYQITRTYNCESNCGVAPRNVPICHNGHMIFVGASAIPAHIAHGDTVTCPTESTLNVSRLAYRMEE